MDAHDIFRKLTRGTKFNVKKDSAKNSSSGNIKTVVDDNKNITLDKPPEDVIMEPAEVSASDDGNVMTLLGTITSAMNSKKQKAKKPVTEDKIALLAQEKVNRFRNENNITVVGRYVDPPISTFLQLNGKYNVNPQLIMKFEDCGYNIPTKIQMQAIPVMLQGRQIVACAPTGSGKTGAFLLPIIHSLAGPQKQGFRAVILCPTRELAKQTLCECVRLSEGTGLRAFTIGNVKQATEKFGPKSSMKFDILITTPNRLCFLLNQDPPAVSLVNVEWLVIDEADKLFEEGVRGFRDQLAAVTKACSNKYKKCAMFSATHTPAVAKWARRNLRGLICVTIGQRNAACKSVAQELLYVGDESGKLIAFRDLIRKGLKPPVLVFVQSKQRAQELFTELIYDGINVDVIHSDRPQTQRDNVVKSFREGKIWVLISTELMGRGIDFLGVNLVVNYDFPSSAIAYIHRIGRAGRANNLGKAITFFTQNDGVLLRSIAQVLRSSGCEVPEYMLTLKKANKREKKKLLNAAPGRENITTTPVYEQQKLEKKKKRIERAKARVGAKNKPLQSSSSDSGTGDNTSQEKKRKSSETLKTNSTKRRKISDKATVGKKSKGPVVT